MKRYGQGWKEFSLTIRRDRAGNQCECTGECGLHCTLEIVAPNFTLASAIDRRRCTERNGFPAEFAKGNVVLTTAHLCECDPPCQNPEHVLALCQRCHNRIDIAMRVRHRKERARREKEDAGQMVLI